MRALNCTPLSQSIAHQIETGIDVAPVYALAVADNAMHVGISIGPEVHITRLLTSGKQPCFALSISERWGSGSYATISILPAPKLLPDTADNSDSRVRGRSLKFLKEGNRLIVSYLNHGVV